MVTFSSSPVIMSLLIRFQRYPKRHQMTLIIKCLRHLEIVGNYISTFAVLTGLRLERDTSERTYATSFRQSFG